VKRDRKLQFQILRKIEAHESPFILFTQFSENSVGMEQETLEGWTEEEAYNIRLMLRDGLCVSDKVTDAPWFGPAPDDAYAEIYIALTSRGHDLLDAPNWWQRAYKNVVGNLASIFVAVFTAILIQYAASNIFSEKSVESTETQASVP